MENIKDWLSQMLPYGSLGAIGGIAMYLNQVRKGRPFRIGTFLINVFVAGWLGIIVKDFIPASAGDLQYSIVSMTGFLAFPILDYLEEKGANLLINKILGRNQK